MDFLKSDAEDRSISIRRRVGGFGWLPGVLLGIIFLWFGVIWRKAVMICLECIGIG